VFPIDPTISLVVGFFFAIARNAYLMLFLFSFPFTSLGRQLYFDESSISSEIGSEGGGNRDPSMSYG